MDFEKPDLNEWKSVEDRADEFALRNAGELSYNIDPKKYWDNYYNLYHQYLDSEKILDRFDEEEAEENYEFFKYEEARREVFEFSKSIAEYLKSNEIKDLVIVDRSSRPLYIGVMEYWKEVFNDIRMPNIYFVNPKGFKNIDEMSTRELLAVNEDAIYKSDLEEEVDKARTKEEVLDEFRKVYPKLLADKDRPVLIFDTCIHSGDTLSPVTEIFKELGFKDARVGSINPSDAGSAVRTDFFITEKRPEKGCYPYDRDRIIEKTFEHIYSKSTADTEKIQQGNILRKEIKRIMQEYLKTVKD